MCLNTIPPAACARFFPANQACQKSPRQWPHQSKSWRGSNASVLVLHNVYMRAADGFEQFAGFRGAKFFVLRADEQDELVTRDEFKTFLVEQRMMQARKLVE